MLSRPAFLASIQRVAGYHTCDGIQYLGVQGISAAEHVQDLPLRHVQQHAGDLSCQRLRVLLLNQRKHMPTCASTCMRTQALLLNVQLLTRK